MTEFHRKVELQSPEDLQYLVANARRAAKEYLDKDFPPDLRDEGDNTLHQQIEKNVDEYINAIFRTAAPNITIDHMDVSPSMLQSILSSDAHSKALEEEYEPYDTRLHERATTLKRQEAELVEEIAMLRRSVPAKVVEARKRGFVDVEKDESVIKSIEEKIEGGEGVTLEGLDKERQETLERSLGVAIGSVAGLTRTLPEVVAKKERAEEVERYVGKREKRGKK